ncbi:MAG TPA: hypothetical protein VLW85_13115 [Myxococcales bacterium]|nr:hypothetical protein [Myxococcales bacterium]
MLDEYKRECPRCHTVLHGEAMRCSGCHRLLPAKLSQARRTLEAVLLGVLMMSLLAAFLVPDVVRSLKESDEPARVVAPWRGPGAEPATRRWAVPLERNLETVCANTFSRYRDRKFVAASLSQQLGAVTTAQGLRITPESLQLTADEEREAMGLVGEEKRFMRECLRWSYDALRGCEAFKDDLGSREASDCMVPRVLRVLAVAPFSLCAQEAKSDRVRRACGLASQAAAAAADKP